MIKRIEVRMLASILFCSRKKRKILIPKISPKYE